MWVGQASLKRRVFRDCPKANRVGDNRTDKGKESGKVLEASMGGGDEGAREQEILRGMK